MTRTYVKKMLVKFHFAKQAISRAVRRFSTTPLNPAKAGRTLIGTTAGATLLVLSGPVVLWPISDLYLGPKFIQQGLYFHGRELETVRNSESSKSDKAAISIVTESGLEIKNKAELVNRPVLYLSLREATSSHDMFMGISVNVWIFFCVYLSRLDAFFMMSTNHLCCSNHCWLVLQ